MRLHFELSPNKAPVEFTYPHVLATVFHGWLGRNDQHDQLSLYSLGWLQASRSHRGLTYKKPSQEGLDFPTGAHWTVSVPDTAEGLALADSLSRAALAKPHLSWGMQVVKVTEEATPCFGNQRRFLAASPILVKVEATGRPTPDHLRWDDLRADAAMTQTLRHKLDIAGLGSHSSTAQVQFDRKYPGAKTKLITVKNTQLRANFCPVIVSGTPEAVAFAWCVGVGHSTGIGFGSLHDQNRHHS